MQWMYITFLIEDYKTLYPGGMDWWYLCRARSLEREEWGMQSDWNPTWTRHWHWPGQGSPLTAWCCSNLPRLSYWDFIVRCTPDSWDTEVWSWSMWSMHCIKRAAAWWSNGLLWRWSLVCYVWTLDWALTWMSSIHSKCSMFWVSEYCWPIQSLRAGHETFVKQICLNIFRSPYFYWQ